MVKFGILFAQLPDEVVEIILNVNEQTLITESIGSSDAVVRINEGPFKSLKTLFSHFDGDESAVLLLNILEKTVKGKFNL